MKVTKDPHRRYLIRTARELSKRAGRKVRPQEVLEAVLDLAIHDEGLYDPEDDRVISAEKREIRAAASGSPARRFGLPELEGASSSEVLS